MLDARLSVSHEVYGNPWFRARQLGVFKSSTNPSGR